jgi:hypothetical protein
MGSCRAASFACREIGRKTKTPSFLGKEGVLVAAQGFRPFFTTNII